MAKDTVKKKAPANEIKSISKKEGDKDVRISIEQIENGFLICKSSDWTDKKGQWQSEYKKWYSETNPLDSIDFSSIDTELADGFSD